MLCTEAAACSTASAVSGKRTSSFLVAVYPDGQQSTSSYNIMVDCSLSQTLQRKVQADQHYDMDKDGRQAVSDANA